MRTIILAAGIGSRLKGIHKDQPKCLLKINDRSLISRQVETLGKYGVKEFVVVVGYKRQHIMDHLKEHDNITYVANDDYETTNTLSSYRLALQMQGCDECILVNGDVVFEDKVAQMITDPSYPNAAMVEMGDFDQEAVKVSIDADANIISIGKEIESCAGEAVGIYRLSHSVNQALVASDDDPGLYYEDRLNDLLPFDHGFHAIDMSGLLGAEIDCDEDYYALMKSMKQKGLA